MRRRLFKVSLGLQTFNPSASSTFVSSSTSFNISYGDGSFFSGTQFTDTFKISGATVSSQQFAQITDGGGGGIVAGAIVSFTNGYLS